MCRSLIGRTKSTCGASDPDRGASRPAMRATSAICCARSPIGARKRRPLTERRSPSAESNGAAVNGLVLLEQARGRFEQAKTLFCQVIELEPAEPLYPRNLENLLTKSER